MTTDGVAYRDLVDGIPTVMVTGDDLLGRPLTVQQVDDDGVTWFLVSDEASWLAGADGRDVNIAFQSTDAWVSALGHAMVVPDHGLGDPVSGAFFDEGETPVALRVDVRRAETWDAPGRLGQLLEIGRALVTGDKAEPGERGSLRPSA